MIFLIDLFTDFAYTIGFIGLVFFFIFIKGKFNQFFFKGRWNPDKTIKTYNTPLYFELLYIFVFTVFLALSIWGLWGQKWYYMLINIVYIIPMFFSISRIIKATDDKIELTKNMIAYSTNKSERNVINNPISFEFTTISSDRISMQSNPQDEVILVKSIV